MESKVPTDAGSAVDDVAGTGRRLQPQQQTPGVSPTSETTDSTISNTTAQNAAASPSDSGEGGGTGPKSSVPSGAAAAAKVSRKRTKTGCLTCRKRRIKCGEQRPTCANCIKSKRTCEGYTQRVVFKEGINGMYRSEIMPAGSVERRVIHPYPIQPAPIAPASAVGYNLQPQPITPLDQTKPPHLRDIYEERQNLQSAFHGHSHSQSSVTPLEHRSQYQQQQDPYGQHPQVSTTQQDQGGHFARYFPHVPGSAAGPPFPGSPTSGRPTFGAPAESGTTSIFGHEASVGQYGSGSPSIQFTPSHQLGLGNLNTCPFNPPIDRKYAVASGGEQMAQPASDFGRMARNDDIHNPTSSGPSGPASGPAAIAAGVGPGSSGANFVPEFVQLHKAPGIENDHGDRGDDMYEDEDEDEDDDEDDDDGDEDYEVGELDKIMMDPAGEGTVNPRTDISNVIGLHSGRVGDSRISFRSFLPDQDILTNYHPTMSSSPLMDHMTAKIFCHFIYVLGPSLSLFERHPPNPHVAFTPGAGLSGPQNVWSYTIPVLALSHPPLLHAILALSSLHISKLTHGPTHPSLLHYHLALRRLGKAIASDKYRGHAATLAATLVLGYYETMAAEHDKWSSHIHGAKHLLKEIDFGRLARRVEVMEEEGLDGQSSHEPPPSLLKLRKMRRQRVVNGADENLTAYIMGKTKRRPHPSGRRIPAAPFSRKEIETIQLQEDLFWFFAKMDCYQSILSGCPLVLDYVYWSQCPPRARIGTLGTTYGSSDHFYLLLGRLCDFQVRDLKRKQAVQKANGGMWIPPPEMGGPPRGMGRGRGRGGAPPQGAGGPSGMQGPPGSSAGARGPPQFPGGPSGVPPGGMQGPHGYSGPAGMGGPPGGAGRGAGMGPPPGGPPLEQIQFGMIPTPGPTRLPSAFANLAGDSPGSHLDPPQEQEQGPQTHEDLEAATVLAESEWNEIYEAFRVFQESLGHEYQPLPIEYMPVQNTPFGPAIYFRTYSIATLQSLYNMALIILHRCHPSMPAISMVAAGVAARKTAKLAIDIARITAGLVPTDPTGQINPALGASLIEASLPMFFASVQHQDQAQRDWVVMKLREVARLTGWASASRVLLGCQRAWEKAAEMGRGPPYTRPPFEEEGELYYEAINVQMAAGTGQGEDADEATGNKRFMWKNAGRRTAGAIGILGEEGEGLGVAGLGFGTGY